MSFSQSRSAYLQASASGASHLGLLLLVYDALAGDLRKAGDAARSRDISQRCSYSNHALALLAHLENWTEYLDDAALQQHLLNFYQYLRAQILANQTEDDASSFEALAGFVIETRAAWQEKEQAQLDQQKRKRAFTEEEYPKTGLGEQKGPSAWSA